MAPSLHTQTPLPPPPEGAAGRPVRAKPHINGVVFQFLSAMIMLNGFKGLDGMEFGGWIRGQVGGHMQFLTNWGLFLATATCLLGALSDLLPGITLLKKAKRGVLLVALPLGITISSIYWTLILLAPHFIIPEPSTTPSSSSSPISSTTTNKSHAQPGAPSSSSDVLRSLRIPLWIDLSLHLVPGLVLAVDFFFRERKFRPPFSTRYAKLASLLFAITYGVWVEWCASYNGHFPYPFLPVDSLSIRLAIYTAATAFAYGSFKVLNGLHA